MFMRDLMPLSSEELSSTVKVKVAGSSETFVPVYQSTC
jgi:hypothetical protein